MAFTHKILDELPGGKADYNFGDSSGDGLIVQVSADKEEWVGFFAFGGSSSLYGVFGWPESDKVFVISKGSGYIVNVNDPSEVEEVNIGTISSIDVLPNKSVVVANSTKVALLGATGEVWAVNNDGLQGIRITGVSDDTITAQSQEKGSVEWSDFKIDVSTGKLI